MNSRSIDPKPGTLRSKHRNQPACVIGTRAAVITRGSLEASVVERLAADKSVCWLSVGSFDGIMGSLCLERSEAVVAWLDTVQSDIVIEWAPGSHSTRHGRQHCRFSVTTRFSAMLIVEGRGRP